MPKVKKPKLTVKEQKLVKGIAEGKKKRTAGIEAGYTGKPETISVNVSKVLKKPNVQEALEQAFIKHGITIDQAIAPIGKALTATKVQIHGNGEEAFAEVVEDIDLQLKGSDRALKLMNIGQNKEGGDVHYHLHQAEMREKYDL